MTILANNFWRAVRCLHTSSKVYGAEASPLYQLRQRTGIAYNLCRAALNQHNNNVTEAEAWLKAQEIAHGLQKATKVRGRSAREGLVSLAIHQDNKMITVVELNCETDFVAKNQTFKDLATDLTSQIASMQEGCDVHKISDQNFVDQMLLSKDHLKVIDNQVVPLISKLGENIVVQKASHFRCADDTIKLFGQIHAQTNQKTCNDLEIISGRFGAIVALKDLINESRSMKTFGNRLCRHVIGFNPTYIELPDNVRQHLEKIEQEEAAKCQDIEDHKNEEMSKEEVDEGETHSDSEESHLNKANRDDWPSIMDQQLIMSEDKTVREFCKDNNFSIVYFNRFECGVEQ